MPKFLANPLYHWSHLELQRLFGITELINEASLLPESGKLPMRNSAEMISGKGNHEVFQGGGFLYHR